MKPPTDLFSRLPTVTDLLENPRIKSLVDRVQEMEVTNGVRQFVERMRSEVSRRAHDAPIPSIGELADRAARFILGRHAAEQPQAINATGHLWPSGLSSPPLADEAVATLTAASQHYHLTGSGRTTKLAAELAGGQAARLFNTPAAAMLVAMATLPEGRAIAVARGELGTLDAGLRLTDLAEQAGATLMEIGATDSVTLDDYQRALDSGAGMVLRIEAMPYALRGRSCRPELGDLVKLAESRSARVVHNIGRGSLAPLGDSLPLDVVTASQSLAAGVALAIARGDGYIGGPACGIAIGRREAVERLSTSPLAMLLKPDPIVECALAGTLTLLREPDRAAMAIPALSLLSTPILNLESRAERIAAQIAVLPGIVSATAVEIPASDDLGATRPLPSFGVSIICEQHDLSRIQSQLDASHPRVIGSWHGDRLTLDLRTVAPDEDIALVTAFEPPASSEQHTD